MKITVNKETKEISDTLHIEALLDFLSIEDTQGVAVAVNEMIVARNTWNSSFLKEGDQVLLIRATAGG